MQMVYNTHMRYKKRRQYVWSADLAYAVGLLASDGCLQKDGRHIDLTSVDYEQLENFNVALQLDRRISKKQASNDHSGYRVQFSDVALYDFLLKVGLMPAKSQKIGSLNVPKEFFMDFVRGVFDGDGTVYGFWDKRWRSSYTFSISFASASKAFLSYMREELHATLGTEGSICTGKRALRLQYAKKDSVLLYRHMYASPSSLFLSRKKSKLEKCISISENR